MSRILVTGGAGFIGSHTLRELSKADHSVVVVDNLSEGHAEAIPGEVLERGDIGDESFLDSVFQRHHFDAVMHFASRCYVGESIENPRLYFEENVGKALTLLRVMLRRQVHRFILSSSCATYGDPIRVPIDEDHPQNPVNPYGDSKYFIERILLHYNQAHSLHFVALRYFNAAGASRDGTIGESHDPEPHLIPRVLKVAKGELEKLQIFGDDYPTEDGTCVRDYIHVEDLASAHALALKWLENGKDSRFFNLGTGKGYSVRSVVEKVKEVTGVKVPIEIGPRRIGDPPELVADPTRANQELKWSPHYSDLDTIVRTAWEWEKNRRF